eukprot:CAMPEP_0182853162 /NCGR_PEP_ID=MMETSP0034_2-20130328/552_1 /TAXON_ID=156128 /ORGANISM="Nephroselmis pyriformis, Strain CCMP717" /LENGTH=88 /DNA_ID=CAMNT_0024983917 /DNA_START=202 /DNA_END=465 /DNA_ORIENTATION=+
MVVPVARPACISSSAAASPSLRAAATDTRLVATTSTTPPHHVSTLGTPESDIAHPSTEPIMGSRLKARPMARGGMYLRRKLMFVCPIT